MRNFFLFFFITLITGNPILAILVIVVLYVLLDYQFTGFSRRYFRGIRRSAEIRSIKRILSINPHDAASRSRLGRLLVESRRFSEAVAELEVAMERMSESEETQCDLGMAYIWTGKLKQGEALIQQAMDRNPRLRYGEPYLRWGEFLLREGKGKDAVEVMEKFNHIHTSSVEGQHRLGEAYRMIGNAAKAVLPYRRALVVFKQSPAYKRRIERVWFWRARFRLLMDRVTKR